MKTFLIVAILMLACFVGNSFGQRKSVSAAEVNGSFKMNYTGKSKGYSNRIYIWANGNGELQIAFILVYPKWNMKGELSEMYGSADGVASIIGDTAVYRSDRLGSCEIKIKFVKNGVIKVTQDSDPLNCGFSGDVFATGTYKKVSSKKPSFK
jgi:hypothetical protein